MGRRVLHAAIATSIAPARGLAARRSRGALLAVTVIAALAAPALVQAAPVQVRAASPLILVLHGGGWQSGDVTSMFHYRDDFQRHGYRTRVVPYPLGSVSRSIDHIDAIAQRERRAGAPVIAYGISAGGTIASALAAVGRVDGGVNVLGPTDFTTWASPVGLAMMMAADMTDAEKIAASPYRRLNGLQTPQLLQCGALDPVTTYDQCVRYTSAARHGNPDTTLHTTYNAHGQWPGDRDRARAWVQARWPAARPRPGKRAIRETVAKRSTGHRQPRIR